MTENNPSIFEDLGSENKTLFGYPSREKTSGNKRPALTGHASPRNKSSRMLQQSIQKRNSGRGECGRSLAPNGRKRRKKRGNNVSILLTIEKRWKKMI